MIRRTIAGIVVAMMLLVMAPVQTASADEVLPACPDIVPATQPAGKVLRVLAVGDSITGACQWQQELSRLLTEAGVPHVITTYAKYGSRCLYWADKIGQVVTAARPDLVYLYCGTNDDPDEMCPGGEVCTRWAFRALVEAIHGYREPAPQIVPALIGISDLTLVPAWLAEAEYRAVDNLYSQFHYYVLPQANPPWFPGFASIDRMPGTDVYLEGDGCIPTETVCGVHPNQRGYETIGRMEYDAAQGGMGWTAALDLGEPELCGMSGHRVGYPRPLYIPC